MIDNAEFVPSASRVSPNEGNSWEGTTLRRTSMLQPTHA